MHPLRSHHSTNALEKVLNSEKVVQKVAESMLSFVALFLSFTAVAELSETVFSPLQMWLTRLCFVSCTDVAELSD